MNLHGKTIVLTGASSGIGEAAALQLARLGAELCLVARRGDELARVADAIRTEGGRCHCYPADLADADSTQALVQALLAAHPRIDVLVNNAGRSIRRPIVQALDRMHDYERTMQLNYFGALRLTLGLLPRLLEQGGGQVVLSSTMSTQLPIPLFSAYLASKSALESFGRSLAAELGHRGIVVTTVYFPMVRTPMSGRTDIYKHMPMLNTERAGGWIVDAITRPSARRSSPFGVLGSVALAGLPGPVTRLSQHGFRLMDALLTRRSKKQP